MSLPSGTRIGPYEVTAQIGAGGMGEVYRATDTNLKRAVALEVLPAALATDTDRLARFQREAEVLATLNHPLIAAIYGLERAGGTTALVMELVECPTLADRIAQGPVPLNEALPIATQIAEALEAAHEQGIVHRDLKPANIKVRPDGTVKILDFGLAKAMVPESGPGIPELTALPTITTPAMTQAGMILGTAAYMSPEQAKGRPADKRSDVWAFGAVLYEMLTGARAFDGDDMVDVLGAVARLDPDWSKLPADVPVPVRALLERCLTKDRRQRVADIAAARFVLGDMERLGARGAGPVPPLSAPQAGSRRGTLGIAAAAAAVAALVAGAGAWSLRPSPAPAPVVQFSYSLPDGQTFSGFGRQMVDVSPDGTQIVYTAGGRLYVRGLNDLVARPVPGSEEANSLQAVLQPTFAPDGQSIVYFGGGGTTWTINRIPIAGGTPTIVASSDFQPVGLAWHEDALLVGQGSEGISRIPAGGGALERIVEVGPGEAAHGPQMLPDGRTLIFTLARGPDAVARWDRAQIVAQSLEDGTRRVLIDGGSDARYLSTGHLIYVVAGTLFAVPFDAGTLQTIGSAQPVVVGVRRAAGGQSGAAQVAVAPNGTLVYVPGPASLVSSARGLAIGDGNTDSVPVAIPMGDYTQPRVSPEGRAVAVDRRDAGGFDIWTYELSGRTEMRRLTFGGTSRYPLWSAEGRRVTYPVHSRRQGGPVLAGRGRQRSGGAVDRGRGGRGTPSRSVVARRPPPAVLRVDR